MVHRRVLVGEKLEQPDSFVLAVALEFLPEHDLVSLVVRPVVEHEPRAAIGPLDAPSGENARDVDDVLLRVPAVHAECVQLHQFAGVILVDASPHPRSPSPQRGEGARGRGPRRYALGIIQIEQHGGAARRRDEQVFEAAERPWPDRFLDIGRQQKPVGSLAHKDVEVVRPEVDHHLAQLALRDGRADDRELLQLAAELAELLHRSRAAHAGRIAGRGRLALQALALLHRIAIAPREVRAIVVEDLEFPLARRETGIGNVIRIELLLDPAHHPDLGDAVGFAGASAVRQPIQRMERRIARRQSGCDTGSLRGQHTEGGNYGKHVSGLTSLRKPS